MTVTLAQQHTAESSGCWLESQIYQTVAVISTDFYTLLYIVCILCFICIVTNEPRLFHCLSWRLSDPENSKLTEIKYNPPAQLLENKQRPDRWWSKTVQAAQPLSLAGWDQYTSHLWKQKSTLSPSFIWLFSVDVLISMNPLKAPHRIQQPAAESELHRTWLMLKRSSCELICPLTDTHSSLHLLMRTQWSTSYIFSIHANYLKFFGVWWINTKEKSK